MLRRPISSPRRTTLVVALLAILLMGAESADKDKKSSGVIDRIAGWLTAEVEKGAGKFIDAAYAGNADGAYSYTSAKFKRWVDRDEFRAFVRSRTWPEASNITWTNRKVSTSTDTGSRGDLDGTFTLKGGAE